MDNGRSDHPSSLLDDELRQRLPKLYSQEGNDDPIAQAKFFTPDSNWSWFATYAELNISCLMWSSGLCRVV
jgi:hypothetical protein